MRQRRCAWLQDVENLVVAGLSQCLPVAVLTIISFACGGVLILMAMVQPGQWLPGNLLLLNATVCAVCAAMVGLAWLQPWEVWMCCALCRLDSGEAQHLQSCIVSYG
jgi:hypothetical protein